MLRTILALVIVALLQPTAALRMPVHAVQQRAGRTLQPQMALPSMKDAEALSDEELNKEITTAQKELFELRKKVKTRQEVKPHLFTHTKHRIAQLNTLLAKRAQ